MASEHEPMIALMRANSRAQREGMAATPPRPAPLRGAASHSGADLLNALEAEGWQLAPVPSEPQGSASPAVEHVIERTTPDVGPHWSCSCGATGTHSGTHSREHSIAEHIEYALAEFLRSGPGLVSAVTDGKVLPGMGGSAERTQRLVEERIIAPIRRMLPAPVLPQGGEGRFSRAVASLRNDAEMRSTWPAHTAEDLEHRDGGVAEFDAAADFLAAAPASPVAEPRQEITKKECKHCGHFVSFGTAYTGPTAEDRERFYPPVAEPREGETDR